MSRSPFPSLRVASGLLPTDLFGRALDDKTLEGREPANYGFGARKTVREAASRAFDDLTAEWHAFTRDRERGRSGARDWLRALFDELDFGILTETPAGGLIVEDKAFKITHTWQHVPIHLIPWAVDLDHRTKGVAGAAGAAPQSMVQELLNRTEQYLWAIVSNGQKLRLLRDSRALAGSAYIEFDLELIFTEQLFSDFMLLFRLVHASRFAVGPEDPPSACWLEKWRSTAEKQGERAKERLQVGVKEAINALGTGFLRHQANADLRERLASGQLAGDDYKRAILRLVYRLLFWFVAEERDVLLDPEAPVAARDRYAKFFSAQRLRERARRGGADHHEDLWEALRLVFVTLGSEEGEARLALPGIGGIFERITRDDQGDLVKPSLPDELDEPLERLRLTNKALITAVRHMAVVDSDGQRRRVDFLHLDSEELGSVYESLLELHPSYDPANQTFTLTAAAGNERKTTGSYYTPPSLVGALLDSALDPVLDEATFSAEDPDAKVEALLNVTVCDPACGSGHFLVAAARRIARRVAQLRSGENEPTPKDVRHAMREVVSRCIHGVDINEMAAELAKVSLWLESVEPGKPLPFLDTNIRVGNSLLGTTPALIEAGIPKEAFKPLVGDDKDAARAIAKLNAKEQDGQLEMFSSGALELSNEALAKHTTELVHRLPARLTDVYAQRRRLRQIDRERFSAKRIADAWCAAFVQEKTPDTALFPITEGTLRWIGDGPTNLIQEQTAASVDRLAQDYRFFHWHLEFPHVFAVPHSGSDIDAATGWRGGFACMIGNPPWDQVQVDAREFFAVSAPHIARAGNMAARNKLLERLAIERPELLASFTMETRRNDGVKHFVHASGRYALTAHGRLNTYSLFAECVRSTVSPSGRCGQVLPTGIATDSFNQYFFADLVRTSTIVSVYDFENEEKIFPDVTNKFRFCLWTIAGKYAQHEAIYLSFRLRDTTQIPARRYTLGSNEIALLNPNTLTCPVFDYRRNAEITLDIYRRVPVLIREADPCANPWNISFQLMFMMNTDSHRFRTGEQLENEGWARSGNIFTLNESRMLPLYEAKMAHHFDHRFGTYEDATQAQKNKGTLPRSSIQQKNDPFHFSLPRYWVVEKEVNERLDSKGWDKTWLLGWRDVTGTANERTVVCGVIPRAAVGHTYPLAITSSSHIAGLYGNLCSFILDFAARQKLAGSHVTYNYFTQLPVLPPETYEQSSAWDGGCELSKWIYVRVLELSYTAYDLEGFARDHGDEGAPFRWDRERRFWLRVELDAAYFHLYGVPRDDVDYIMDTFRAFRNNDPERFARTKTAILDIYDALAKAIETGEPYRTVLDPPPGQGARHPARPSEVTAP